MNLTGTWVGATREDDLSYHWRVTQRDDSVFIYATFNDQTVAVYYYSGTIVAGVLHINAYIPVVAVMLDARYFVLPKWEDERDMLFCREGVAELSADSAWAHYDAIGNQRDQL